MSGCGGSPSTPGQAAEPLGATAAPSAPEVEESATAAAHGDADDLTEADPPASYERRCTLDPSRPECNSDFPESVYPDAGGGVPPNAEPVTAIRPEERAAVIKTPSGNIGCELSEDYSGCGVLSMIESGVMGTGPSGDANWYVTLPSRWDPRVMPEIIAKMDAPSFEFQDVPAQVVEYGQVIRHGEIVCASESDGLTCWNVWTGHGAFMNREWIYTW